MGRTRDTVDIVKGLVATLTPTLSITGTVDHGDGTYTLNIPNTYWLRISKRITISAIEYRVTALVINESITISGPSVPVVDSFVIPAPHFLHGDVEMTAIKQQEPKAAIDRTPFIYLIEPLTETELKDEFSIWGRSSTPRLYFMDESVTNWNSEQHKTNVIEPVRQMIELFFDKIADEEDNLYGEVKERQTTAAPDWGKFVSDKGYKGKFFADTISGLQVGFDFLMSKTSCDDLTDSTECPLQVQVYTFAESVGGANDGKAVAAVEDSLGAVTFAWTGPSGFTSTDQLIEDLVPGVYIVTTTDGGGASCSKGASGTVASGGVAPTCNISIDSLTITDPSLFGASDGQVLMNLSGDVGPLFFKWTDGQIVNPAIGLSAGDIAGLVTDGGVACSCNDIIIATLNDGPALIFSSISDVATSFGANYSGIDTQFWTDGIDTYTGMSPTFTEWFDNSVKNVRIDVETPSLITSFVADNKGVTFLNISACTGMTNLQTQNNTDLLEIITGTSSTVWAVYHVRQGGLIGTHDCSGLTGLAGNCMWHTNPLLTHINLPVTSQSIDPFWAYDTAIGVLDWDRVPGAFNRNNCRVDVKDCGMTAAEVNENLVKMDTVATLGFTGGVIDIGGSNAAPDNSSGGFDGVAAAASLVTKGKTVNTS